MKTAYQRGFDDKTTRFIKEKYPKTGKMNQKKVIKGVEESKLDDFNKEYNDFCKKIGFRKNFKNMNYFWPFTGEKRQITDGNQHKLFHQLLF